MAVFGCLLLRNYRQDFAKGVPAGIPPEALAPFSNLLLLAQMRPQLEATFSRYEGGGSLLQTLFANVRTALLHGIQLVFLSSAIVMTVAIVLHVLLKNVPLRHSHAPGPEAQAQVVKSPEQDPH